MTESIWPTIHAERAALSDDLEGLTTEQWETRSLCREWTVHDVLAHQVSTARMTPGRFLLRFAGAGFNFHKFSAKQVALEGAGGPVATMKAFRDVRDRSTAPPGPQDTWLGEVLVHSEDIRRPLGIHHDYPLPEVARAIRFYADTDTLIGGKTRVAGVTLKATDTDFSLGSGPIAEGPAVALMLVAAGRMSALDELSGPGVEVLRSRS